MNRTARLLLACALPAVLVAQAPVPVLDGAELQKALDKLQVLGSVLYVAAHPDDENTDLLATLSKGRQVRAGYLALTRGGGGQNLIGPELGDPLAAIRTQELLAARRLDGAEQFFTGAVDFGFSKTADETFATWGREAVLADVVRVLRTFRPDVIVTRFPPDARAGHGHHTASAILAIEAFAAAADPKRFPEQITAGLRPWQARRVLWNHFRFGDNAPPPAPGSLTLDVGTFDPLLGRSFGELAAESRSQHRSQGFGVLARRGSRLESFEPLAGAPATADLLEGVDLTWSRVKGGAAVGELLAQARKAFRSERPAAVLPLLLKAQTALQGLPADAQADPLVQAKAAELREVLRAAAGLWVEAIADRQSAAPGDRLTVSAALISRGDAGLSLESLALEAITPEGVAPVQARAIQQPLGDNQLRKETFELVLPATAPLGQPHWLGGPGALAWRNRPESPSPYQLRARLGQGGATFEVTVPLRFRFRDPVQGERYQPFIVVPTVLVNLAERVEVFGEARPQDVTLKTMAGAAKAAGRLRLQVPEGWRAEPGEQAFTLGRAGEEQTFTFRLTPPASPAHGELKVLVDIGTGFQPARGAQRLDHPHIPLQTLLPEAVARLERFDLKHNGKRIGYVMGAGDEIPQSLRRLGYEVELLSDEALATRDLKGFDAIVLGIRAFNTRAALVSLKDRLHDYVAKGGTEIVLYTVNAGFPGINADMVTQAIGPYPFKVGRKRVTEERAAVRILAPEHPAFHWPNKITSADFEGWVQERSLYDAEGWDAKYKPLLAMHDAGEADQEGSLIVAEHGKGHFVYTSLAFFRQLPEGVPGAYRLFANLLALGGKHD
ncbi:MAG: PIG-L family deacetylase [Holophagaceae bacterium]|nr:PIG-L family deacetylase [Holophagaceae bacterium]